jgi:hypothetical protein
LNSIIFDKYPKNIRNIFKNSPTDAQNLIPMAPVMSFDLLNKQAVNNYYSPRQFRHQNNQSSYSKPLNNINNILAYNQTHHSTQNLLNKENQKSATITPLTSSSNINNKTQTATTTPTIVNTEIIDAAQRILAKRQNNAESSANENNSAWSLVKNMKSKFEDPSATKNCTSNVTIQLTPKSIIKKFEQITRDNQQK